ncbi:hypothetical protein BDF20DRAFT_224855 [Mycotypha africana]|uniref:uncharacterized protein n=1 Tax=Mycotypha africana TaxID=64632 RepID=UPI002300ED2D|nr:uncharacterized protein BDF20DRAFT_224855 [Mycotypha africana]KAI8967575.1 hypothetical protein BDF20DRAFT_224855 [Mycotypha africana]
MRSIMTVPSFEKINDSSTSAQECYSSDAEQPIVDDAEVLLVQSNTATAILSKKQNITFTYAEKDDDNNGDFVLEMNDIPYTIKAKNIAYKEECSSVSGDNITNNVVDVDKDGSRNNRKQQVLPSHSSSSAVRHYIPVQRVEADFLQDSYQYNDLHQAYHNHEHISIKNTTTTSNKGDENNHNNDKSMNSTECIRCPSDTLSNKLKIHESPAINPVSCGSIHSHSESAPNEGSSFTMHNKDCLREPVCLFLDDKEKAKKDLQSSSTTEAVDRDISHNNVHFNDLENIHNSESSMVTLSDNEQQNRTLSDVDDVDDKESFEIEICECPVEHVDFHNELAAKKQQQQQRQARFSFGIPIVSKEVNDEDEQFKEWKILADKHFNYTLTMKDKKKLMASYHKDRYSKHQESQSDCSDDNNSQLQQQSKSSTLWEVLHRSHRSLDWLKCSPFVRTLLHHYACPLKIINLPENAKYKQIQNYFFSPNVLVSTLQSKSCHYSGLLNFTLSVVIIVYQAYSKFSMCLCCV